jgi:hypothetical protein
VIWPLHGPVHSRLRVCHVCVRTQPWHMRGLQWQMQSECGPHVLRAYIRALGPR